MEGRDSKFGSVLEQVMANVEAAGVQEQRIKSMVEFYGKAIEGTEPYDAIVQMAEENKMAPDEVFALLKEAGHVDVETLDELKVLAEKEEPTVEEKIGEPKAEKPKEMTGKDAKDLGKLKPLGKAFAKESVDEKVAFEIPSAWGGLMQRRDQNTPKSLRADAKAKDREATKLRRDADKLEKAEMKAKDKAKKESKEVDEGISPPDIDKLKEQDQIKILTEADIAKDVAALLAQAGKALTAGEYDEAMDLVGRLAQIQSALPAKLEKSPASPKEEKEELPVEELSKDEEPPVEDLPVV